MPDILYTIFIYPIEQIISLSFLFIFRASNNPALSILGVSFTVSILTLPLYLLAEKHQRFERNAQKRMKPQIDNIKSAFSGDERFLRLAACYRQNHYHPIHSLRLSISLIIQIPFFIAAYYFLSNLDVIKGASFGPINDLSKPDFLIKLNSISINILPIVMSLTNLASTIIYSKSFPAKEKIQLYCTAGLFMFLLYNSPSAMVLYWTGNNVFSLVKNIIQKSKLYKAVASEKFQKHARLAKEELTPAFRFLSSKKTLRIMQVPQVFSARHENSWNIIMLVLSLVILFLLEGVVIPSSLISSSVQEFPIIENHKSPFPFILNTALQSFGTFFLWPLCIYGILSQKARKNMAIAAICFAVIAMINAFVTPANQGFLTPDFTLSERPVYSKQSIFLNVFIIIVAIMSICFFFNHLKKILLSILTIALCSLVLAGAINNIKIFKETKEFQLLLVKNRSGNDELPYQFSTGGKNILVIMLDRAMGGYIPYIFDEKPTLHDSFDGFVWYKNTLSFSPTTLYAAPAVFGGYEYTPLNMQKRPDVSLLDKHNESLLLLPKIFLEHEFMVGITDPPWANYSNPPDLSIFDQYPQLHAENIVGKYNERWFQSNENKLVTTNNAELIFQALIRFSFFKIMPLSFRNFVYDNGEWLMQRKLVQNNETVDDFSLWDAFSLWTLNHYIALDMLPNITSINKTHLNTYNVLVNELTHNPNFLKLPDYIPSNTITSMGDGPLAEDPHYHVNMAAILLLGKWFDFLKENNVYNNTRIIVVSDHGWVENNIPNNFSVAAGLSVNNFAPILLVKDFDSHGRLSINNFFMTNADVPLMALNDIVENPVNPWTGKLLKSDKLEGATITAVTVWHPDQLTNKYQFDIKPDECLHVHDNIFDPANWSSVVK